MGIILVMTMSLAIILPTTSYALFPRYYPVIRTAPIGGGGGSSGSIGNGGGSHSGYHGPIWQPQMHYAPGSGGGTSTFSTPSSNGNGQPQAVVTENSNGVVYQSTPYGTIGHGGVHAPVKQTTSQSTTSTSTPTVITKTITITKTYTQYIYDTYEVNHYIYYYMYPVIKWVFTLTNIGQLQAPGYHNVGNEKLFLPGFGSGSGIFVPVFAQEAIYIFNIAPTTKPQITGWYTGSTSQSSSGPYLVSQSSSPPQLTGVQQAVNSAGQAVNNIQQLATTNPNGLASTTYVYYSNTLPGSNNTKIVQLNPYYYSPQDIAVAYLTGNLYETQAISDLLHGNVIGAAQSAWNSAYYYLKGVYEQAWNFYSGVVSTLFNTVTNPNNPWNVAHALSIGNIIGAAGTVLNTWKSAINNGWNQAMGWFSHL